MAERDTKKYVLKRGNEVVYVGITNDPERRETQHRQEKAFDKMELVGRPCTRESAEQWEEDRIATYMRNHGGLTPKYNKNETGK